MVLDEFFVLVCIDLIEADREHCRIACTYRRKFVLERKLFEYWFGCHFDPFFTKAIIVNQKSWEIASLLDYVKILDEIFLQVILSETSDMMNIPCFGISILLPGFIPFGITYPSSIITHHPLARITRYYKKWCFRSNINDAWNDLSQ